MERANPNMVFLQELPGKNMGYRFDQRWKGGSSLFSQLVIGDFFFTNFFIPELPRKKILNPEIEC
jgi:hypothetical protein